MNCMFGQARQTKHGVFGNAILSRFPLTRKQELELPRGSLTRDDGSRMPGQNERRLALAAIVSPFRDAEAFDFMCICTHVGIYNTAQQASKAHAPAEIFDNFVNSEASVNTPAVLAGDLNCAWTEPFTGVVARLDRNWNIYPSDGTRTAKSKGKKHKIGLATSATVAGAGGGFKTALQDGTTTGDNRAFLRDFGDIPRWTSAFGPPSVGLCMEATVVLCSSQNPL
mmetsp:Transcript_86995/g.246689  ORF Transcript_86995/g.246689 Transcript_86995/m.246689 type:complete len:225 (+) Transcript_86995:345-1019(+)